MLCDVTSLLGAACLLIWSGRRAVTLNLPLILLGFIGALAVLLHGWVLGPTHGPLGDQRIGAAWLSAIFGAIALWHAAQHSPIRRIAGGALIGLVVVLALYGAVQVFYTHAQTVADFKTDPDRLLAAHGWPKDSPMAKAFERRLMQPEAIGWFGLANVYATFAAGMLVCGLGLFTGSLREAPRRAFALGALTASAALALVLSMSKGGVIAAIAGGAAFAMLWWLSRTPRIPSKAKCLAAGFLGLAAIAGPIAMVILRGQIGERIGELSLLFRWFYMQAASRIIAAHPLVGVGPDGFQQAFTMVKPGLCPEEVSSPHCVVFDWSATLGVLGLAWVCVLGRMAWRACSDAVAPNGTHDASTPLSRSDVRTLFAIPVLATLIATFIEAAMITPEVAATRVFGLVLWCASAWVIARAMDSSPISRIATAAMALVLIAHGQIDVAGSLVSSVGLWFGLIGVAAAPIRPAAQGQSAQRAIPHRLAAAGVLAMACLIAFTGTNRVRPWEQKLNEAADTVRPIADAASRLSSLVPTSESAQSPPPDSPQSIAADLARVLGHSVDPTPSGFRSAVTELENRLLPPAAAALDAAFTLEPSDRRPLREASRLHLRLAEAARDRGDAASARSEFDHAVSVMHMDAPTPPAASDLHWLASVRERGASLLNDPEQVSRAIDARLRIVRLDPYNLENAKRLVTDYQALGNTAETRTWARRCLELNKFMRLDREIRALSDAEIKNLTALAHSP
jgi:hypothetical protein